MPFTQNRLLDTKIVKTTVFEEKTTAYENDLCIFEFAIEDLVIICQTTIIALLSMCGNAFRDCRGMTQTEFHGNPKNITVMSGVIKEDLGFCPNDCLRNSHKVTIKFDSLMVEGILMTLYNGSVISFVIHCWNKLNDTYLDVTNDFVWQTDSFKEKLRSENGEGNYEYRYFACAEYPGDECYFDPSSDKYSFHYSYVDLLDYLDKDLISKTSK